METKVVELPLSHQAWAWFEKNKNQALFGVVGILVVGLVVFYVVWSRDQKQVRAGQALSDATTRQMVSGGRQDNPQDYLKITADYPSSKAAARALLLAAGALFRDAKYPEAQAQFEKFTRDYHDSSLLPEALIGVAASLEAQGKTDQALAAYKDIVTRHPSSSVVAQARFAMGALYEKQQHPELARDMYQQLEHDNRNTLLGNEAGMRLEELIEKNPSLAPAPVPPATGAASSPSLQVTPAPGNTNVQVQIAPKK